MYDTLSFKLNLNEEQMKMHVAFISNSCFDENMSKKSCSLCNISTHIFDGQILHFGRIFHMKNSENQAFGDYMIRERCNHILLECVSFMCDFNYFSVLKSSLKHDLQNIYLFSLDSFSLGFLNNSSI